MSFFRRKWKMHLYLNGKDLHDPDNHDGVITHSHSPRAGHPGM